MPFYLAAAFLPAAAFAAQGVGLSASKRGGVIGVGARNAANIASVIAESPAAGQSAAAADKRAEFITRFEAWKDGLESARQACLDAYLLVDGAATGLGALLGAGIAQTGTGAIGAAVGGANIYITKKTIEQEKKRAALQEGVDAARRELTEANLGFDADKKRVAEERRRNNCPPIEEGARNGA